MFLRIAAVALTSLSSLWAFEVERSGGYGSLAIVVERKVGSDALYDTLERELESVFKLPGLHLVWRKLDNNTARETFERIIVVRLRGDCGCNHPPGELKSKILGFTHSSDGIILPFVEIDCDAIRALLYWGGDNVRRSTETMALGRAMARVLAHEMFHVLIGTPKHSRHGIRQETLTPNELVTQPAELCEQDQEDLVNALTDRGVSGHAAD